LLDRLAQIDRALFEAVNGLQSPVLDRLMPFLSDGDFKPFFVVVFVVLLVAGKARGRWAALLVIPLIAMSDQLSSHLVKDTFHRVRPCHVLDHVHLLAGCSHSWSMPSSHAANSAAAALHFALFYRRLAVPLAVVAFAVGYSRVYVGVHYPGDVLVGFAIGVVSALTIRALYRMVSARWSRRTLVSPAP
jgi:undecaprenyl-diphosphatase